jgi:hypothetical protein
MGTINNRAKQTIGGQLAEILGPIPIVEISSEVLLTCTSQPNPCTWSYHTDKSGHVFATLKYVSGLCYDHGFGKVPTRCRAGS